MEFYQTPQERKLELARVRVQKIKKYYGYLFIYVVGMIVYISKTYFGAPLNFFPIKHLSETIMWIWTFFIVVQTLKMLFTENLFGNSWEQRKINEILEKNNQSKNRWE